ncbi:hypothetical protein FIBSPDRAFT_270169 [Athelia psychrophila]|uniref:Uncharacterized protein n=1 Tax=Athelia psychrophila TaxID=1759441 RepID=A0A165X1E8_9AGAM|nr:hypothetical protein FIBSPDRAFT_270169 [Fibularhizoctonia sp. CBS 109695]
MPDINMHQRDPTSNLPNELLAMIFEADMPIYREEGPVLGALLKSGKVFSHVSHRWRSIALDTPSLWTEIHYNDQPLRACTEYLSRSRKAPLDIYINAPCFDRELTSSLLDSLSENIGRCRLLYIAPAAPAFRIPTKSSRMYIALCGASSRIVFNIRPPWRYTILSSTVRKWCTSSPDRATGGARVQCSYSGVLFTSLQTRVTPGSFPHPHPLFGLLHIF